MEAWFVTVIGSERERRGDLAKRGEFEEVREILEI
jgi:hypothetical protein